MAVVSGFFNSVSGDRKYNADHFGRFFDGLICDGVYVNYPEKRANGTYTPANERGFYVSPGDGVSVNIAPGRCFFDHCWMYNDSTEVVDLNSVKPSNALSKKLVAIFIDVDTSQEGRQITFTTVAGNEVANDDQHVADPPTPINTATHTQYPIALIAMNGTVTAINDTNIYRFDATYTDYRKNYFARTPSVEAIVEYSSRTKEEIEARIGRIETPTFTEATTLANINTSENINTLWGKIKKFFNKVLFGTGATAGQVWKVQNNGQADWQNDWGVVTRNGAGLAPVIPAAAEGKQRYLDEFGQWTEPVGTNTNAETVGNVKIGVSGGKYGYWDGNTFKTFRQPTGNAGVGDVRSGVTFANANSDALTGTFAAQEKTVTGSRSAQTVTPDSGKWLSKVTVNKYPDASGTFTTSSNSSAVDMGATNNYRYVNTTGVYDAGRNQGHADENGYILQTHIVGTKGTKVTIGWRYNSDDWHVIRDATTFTTTYDDEYMAWGIGVKYNAPPIRHL